MFREQNYKKKYTLQIFLAKFSFAYQKTHFNSFMLIKENIIYLHFNQQHSTCLTLAST